MKTMKKQAIFPVLMLLVVTALALIGSSFAWFAMSNTASVTAVKAQIEQSSVGLMISQDGTTFTGSVTLGSSAQTYVLPKYFHQVSTEDAEHFFKATIQAKNDSGVVTSITTTADATVAPGTATGTTGNLYGVGSDASRTQVPSGSNTVTVGQTSYDSAASYMVFDLFFQSDSTAALYLNYGTEFNMYASNGSTAASDPKKAMRVAFVDMGNGTALEAKASTTYGTTTFWDPQAIEATTGNTRDYYGIKEAQSTAFAPYSTSSTTNLAGTVKYSGELFNSSTSFTDSSTMAGYTSIAALVAGKVTKVRVIIWLEGNDPDCTKEIAQLWAELALSFFAKASS
ncbi:MAG: hypothetical protein K6G38_02910 [Gammaproteobacteria bacterium]|nr:hypothetical protein [Gammaproteobacteria bacterium]